VLSSFTTLYSTLVEAGLAADAERAGADLPDWDVPDRFVADRVVPDRFVPGCFVPDRFVPDRETTFFAPSLRKSMTPEALPWAKSSARSSAFFTWRCTRGLLQSVSAARLICS
jgi:hypothetical protein